MASLHIDYLKAQFCFSAPNVALLKKWKIICEINKLYQSFMYFRYFMTNVAWTCLLSRNVQQNCKIFSQKVHGVNSEYFVL